MQITRPCPQSAAYFPEGFVTAHAAGSTDEMTSSHSNHGISNIYGYRLEFPENLNEFKVLRLTQRDDPREFRFVLYATMGSATTTMIGGVGLTMHVVIFTQYWRPKNNVPARRWSWLAEHLIENGHSVTVVTPPVAKQGSTDKTMCEAVDCEIEASGVRALRTKQVDANSGLFPGFRSSQDRDVYDPKSTRSRWC